MHMMPFTRHVIAVAGLSLGLGLTGEFGYADDWYREHGMASHYGKGFHGRKAADGDKFSQKEMTAAHRKLRSCPSSLRIIPSAQKPGKMPSYHPIVRGH